MNASGKTIKLRLNEPFGIRDVVRDVVNASGGTAANIFHQTLPDNWSEQANRLLNQYMPKLGEVVKQSMEKIKQEEIAEQRRLGNRLRRAAKWLALAIISGIIGVVLGVLAALYLHLP